MTSDPATVKNPKGTLLIRRSVMMIVIVVFACIIQSFLQQMHRIRHMEDEGMAELRRGILEYAEDHQGRLPPMTNWATLHNAVWPYVKEESFFHSLDDATILFLPNPNLSGQKVLTIKNRTVLLYESEPSRADNSRWVAFLPDRPNPSGDPQFARLEFMKERDWQQTKKSAGL